MFLKMAKAASGFRPTLLGIGTWSYMHWHNGKFGVSMGSKIVASMLQYRTFWITQARRDVRPKGCGHVHVCVASRHHMFVGCLGSKMVAALFQGNMC